MSNKVKKEVDFLFYFQYVYIYASFFVSVLPPRILPVLRAAMRPTLRPADVPLLTVEALPVDEDENIYQARRG